MRELVRPAAWLLPLGVIATALAACGRASMGAPTPFPTIASGATSTADIKASVLQPEATAAPQVVLAAPLQELDVGQHLSASGSYTETETAAAGPMICQVEQGSCAFSYLVSLQVPGVRFLDEEQPPYSGEDHLVNPAMVGPMTRLADLVAAEWGGEYQIMVTDAYDSLLEHDLAQNDAARKYSLHFEGRSIDLILLPLGLERLGRLCALAHQAVFDWVHNEGDHCHASVRADSLCRVCSGVREP